MEFSSNVLLLDSNEDRKHSLETIFKFLGTSCQSGDVEDCLSYLNSTDNIDVCLVGTINEDIKTIMDNNKNVAFILVECPDVDKYKGLANYIGEINCDLNYDELISLLHYCQSFKTMKKNFKKSTDKASTLIKLLVGRGDAISKVRRLIEQVATTDANVLILGESGTGKEVVARAIHELSNRSKKNFVPINCGAIPGELLESELFGHEKGAFTGAITAREGRFELAEGGTLFLDEIGDMPYQMQVKLLRVLQERKFQRVGSNKEINADVRIIAATHQNLEQMVEDGKFREDLFYRLNVFPIETPALRDRQDDIPLLIQELVNRHGKEMHATIRFTQRAMNTLMQNEWKGNVRELSNLIERLLILHPNEVVDLQDLPPKYKGDTLIDDPSAERAALLDAFSNDDDSSYDNQQFDETLDDKPIDLPSLPVIEGEDEMSKAFMPQVGIGEDGINLKEMVSNLEINMIKQALNQCNGVVSKASEILGLRRTTLVEKMKKYDISAQG